MTLSRIAAGEAHTGQPLPWDLCDESGRLLLRQGFVVVHAAQWTRLLDAGLYRRDAAPFAVDAAGGQVERLASREKCTVFERVAAILQRLDSLLAQPPSTDFAPRVLALADAVQQCFAQDADAAIATIQLIELQRYSVRRLVHAAILCELLQRHEGVAPAQRRVLLAAALTMNIAMLDLQDQLNLQTTPPDAAQRAQLRDHPLAATRILKALGVQDAQWLTAVAQHHETIDGKGYPQGLEGADLSRDAQILSMVDRYGSMAIGRAYRAPVLPNVVLKKIFLDKESVDPKLAALLVGAVGMYPPGSLVALASGELAIVVKRSPVASQPLVYCLQDARGLRIDPPRRRLTSEPAFAVARLVAGSELALVPDAAVLWDQSFEMAALPMAGVA
jgi:hypothetical protein